MFGARGGAWNSTTWKKKKIEKHNFCEFRGNKKKTFSECPYYVQRNSFCSPGPRPHVVLRLTRGLSLCAGCRPQGYDHRSLWTPQTPFLARHLWREPHAISQIVVAILQPRSLQLCNFVCKLVLSVRARTARSAIAGLRKRFWAVANRDGDCSCRHDLRTRHPS